VVSTERFFVRTAAPQSLPEDLNANAWTIDVGGLVESPSHLSVAALDALGTRSGRFLLECSGNADPANYGLLSTADWDGVPLTAVLERLKPSARAWRVLVSGLDDAADPAGTSMPARAGSFRETISSARSSQRG